MKKFYIMIECVVVILVNVMLMGESGVGKEVVVQVIYNVIECDGLFVVINCGVFLKELIGSEFFGYEKGVFIGVIVCKEGVFE